MKRIIVGVASLVIAIGLSAGAANAAAGPTVKVRPAKHLVDGQTITVTWGGLRQHRGKNRPSDILVAECTPKFLTTNDTGYCANADPSQYKLLPFAKRGSTTFNVIAGNIESGGSCGTAAENDCIIVVAVRNFIAEVVPGDYGAAPITFRVAS